MVDVNSAAQQAHENAVQQAQMWAQEARTQRETVLSILRYFGLPEHDYEALHLIRRHLEGSHTKCLTCGVEVGQSPQDRCRATCPCFIQTGECNCPRNAGVGVVDHQTFSQKTPTGDGS